MNKANVVGAEENEPMSRANKISIVISILSICISIANMIFIANR